MKVTEEQLKEFCKTYQDKILDSCMNTQFTNTSFVFSTDDREEILTFWKERGYTDIFKNLTLRFKNEK